MNIYGVDTEIIFTTVIPSIIGLVSGLFLGRRGRAAKAKVTENEAEIKHQEAESVAMENAESIISKWQELSNKYEERYIEVMREVTELKAKLIEETRMREKLEERNRTLTIQVNTLKNDAGWNQKNKDEIETD